MLGQTKKKSIPTWRQEEKESNLGWRHKETVQDTTWRQREMVQRMSPHRGYKGKRKINAQVVRGNIPWIINGTTLGRIYAISTNKKTMT